MVQGGHQLAVGGAGGGKVVVTVLEHELQVDGLLFAGGDPGLKLFNVIAATTGPGLVPDLLVQDLAEAGFGTPDVCGQAGGADVGCRQVGLQRGPAGCRARAVGDRGRLRSLGVDLSEQVAVA